MVIVAPLCEQALVGVKFDIVGVIHAPTVTVVEVARVKLPFVAV